jgi:hypothetical protein
MRIFIVLAILAAAAANTYGLFAADRPTTAVVFGALVPLAALAEWWTVRKRVDLTPAAVADRMLISLLVALLAITVVVSVA